MRIEAAVKTLALLSCLALPAAADAAGIVSLPQTGQTTSYATGDDGDLKKGAAWPAPRFGDNTNGTLTDTLTGLIWARDAGNPTAVTCTGGRTNWQGALDYVACLNTHGYLGFNDWRLPNIVEMESLFNDGAANSVTWLTGQGFSNVQTYYWSSTTYAGSADHTWNVVLWSAPQVSLFDSKTVTTYYSWPVRGTTALPAQLRRTGQSVSYAAGDDGQLKVGVPLPTTRFAADSTGGCLTDQLTGLTWIRYPLSTLRTWPDAIDYANSLNLCGYTDWRLPNRQELRSLVNYGESLTAAVLNAQGFGGVKNRQYWTATTDAYDTGRAWSIDLGSGLDVVAYKPGYATQTSLALAVRSGAALPPTGHALSGRITSGGAGLASVTLILAGPVNQVTQTDANGDYAFADLPDGGYTLTPARIYYAFTPPQWALTLSGADTAGMDFAAALATAYGLVDLSDNPAGLLLGNNESLSDIRHVTLGGVTRLLIASANPARVYRSTDGGATLQPADLRHGAQAVYMFPDGQTAFAVGGSYGSKSTDGGQTWTRVTIGGTLYTVFFANSSVGYAAGNAGLLYRTSDGGATWVLKNSYWNRSIYSIWVPDSDAPDTLYYTVANGASTLCRSTDGGLTFQIVTLPEIGNASMNDLFFKDTNTAWAAGGNGEIFKLSGGAWTKTTTPVTVSLDAIAFSPDGLNGWAVGMGGTILRTTDGGETWTQVGSELGILDNLAGVTVVSATEAYIVGYGNIFLKYSNITTALAITTTSPLPAGVVGQAYSQTFTSTAGAGGPYSWNVTSGSLLAGLLLSSGGVLGGDPTTAGNSSFTVQVTDVAGNTSSAPFTLQVNATAALTITTTSPLPAGFVGQAYSQAFTATGGAGSYSWSVISGSLPAGLLLSSGGVLSGNPSTAGDSSFTVEVTDAAGNTTSAPFMLQINASLASIPTLGEWGRLVFVLLVVVIGFDVLRRRGDLA